MTSDINKNKVGKGIAFLYIESISMLFSGYIYWLILSKLTSPAIIGTSSTVISFSALFTAIAAVGISSGIQRFLAKSIGNNSLEESKGIINSALLIISIGISILIIFVTFFNDLIQSSFGIKEEFLILSMVIMALTVISNLFRYFIIASLKTSSIAVASILSTIIKIVITVVLVIIGYEIIGILLGYLSYFVSSTIILSITLKKTIYKRHHLHTNNSFTKTFQNLYEIFKSSIPFWIPNIINTAGNQLGTISIFISSGAEGAGIYFICFSIFTGISLIMSVLSTIAYPTIGSLPDGRKRAVSKFLNITLILTLPLSISIIGYAGQILHIIGEDYMRGSLILQILFLSMLPAVITTGVSILSYAYGDNRKVLFIGFSSSIPKILLYFILVPAIGSIGAAFSFLIGSLIGFVTSIYIGRRIGVNINWKNIFLVLIIPVICITFFKFSEINFILGILGTLSISFISFLKLNIMSDADLEEVLKILPKKVGNPLLNILRKI